MQKDGKLCKVLKILEECTGKKVVLQEVELSTDTTFFDFDNITSKKLKRSKKAAENGSYELFKYKERGKLNYYLVKDNSKVILSLDATELLNGVQVELIEKNPESNEPALPQVILLYKMLSKIYGKVFSGSKQTKGGKYIWQKMFEQGLPIYQAYKFKETDRIETQEELNAFYENRDEDYVLCLKFN